MKYILQLGYIFIASLLITQEADAQCFDNGHSPFQNQGWISCNTSIGPIPERGNTHWILYDFGHEYTLDSLYFWNHNVWGETGMGVKNILIDYSKDKENWITVGPITIEKAPGSWKYTGTQGPSLGNVDARYVLITVISTWREDASCAGLAEIRFGVSNAVDVVEIEAEAEWNISPNPAIDRITVQLPEIEKIQSLSMYNAVGQLVRTLNLPSGKEVSVSIGDLKEGIYFISIGTETEILTKSFVKG
jgi:hypothetical protein